VNFRNRKRYPIRLAHDTADCGPACIQMVAQFYGKDYSLDFLSELCFLSKEGVSLLSIKEAAEGLGFDALPVNISLDSLARSSRLPCILHWNQEHFVVLYEVRKKFVIGDPANGLFKLDKDTFLRAWAATQEGKGTALLLEPTAAFYDHEISAVKNKSYYFSFQYLRPYKKYILQIVMGMALTSLIALAFPFLTQLLIDEGVSNKNIPFVYLILLSQIFLFIGDATLTNIRGWLMLYISKRISYHIIADFLTKLFKLPIKFFDSKKVGDFAQRIDDHHRIERFLTSSILNTLFSVVNILVFTAILWIYNLKILGTYVLLNITGVCWILIFQHRRRQLDYKLFGNKRRNIDKFYEIITGMQEIKLYGSEQVKLEEWGEIQNEYFKLNGNELALEQYQYSGYMFFNNLKNILISFIAVTSVIKGDLTLGALLSISYIVGQTNGPIQQLIDFVKSSQDARLSMDRLQEVHKKENEEGQTPAMAPLIHGDIRLQNVSFQYEGHHSRFVLKDISFVIPRGKITAVVGTSGSGKSTLMKLLLKFYLPVAGSIELGGRDLREISPGQWRKQCGTVMQEGYVFNDTICRNISMTGTAFDRDRMTTALEIANLSAFVKELPMGYHTKVGDAGSGISGGQRQRILIGRAVYKDPDYLFFDEATSSLDSNTERAIMDNLKSFFKGKTVVVIAHRLSTVKNADQIIVLDDGKIVEMGTHSVLTQRKGKYFELVRNQLELGR
jgi:ATP-binding cassette subfamily B protein